MSVVIFIYAAIFFRRVFIITHESGYRMTWAVMIFLISLFMCGYTLFSITLFANLHIFEPNLLVVLIFFFGAIFVAISSRLNHNLIKNLDDLVDKRTLELRRQQKKALAKEKQVQKLKDQFLFIATHELRTPVSAIKLGLETIRDNENLHKKFTKEDIEMLDILEESGNQLTTLVNDLLNSSRIESRKFKIDKKSTDILEVVNKTVNSMRLIAKQTGSKIKITAPKKIVKINTDPNRLKEILRNLISNACKYNKQGGKVEVVILPKDKFIEFTILDEGVGFTKEESKELFTRFGRIRNDQTVDISGTGLGLYICKEIVSKLGGKIFAESPGTNKGSKFTFIIKKK